MSVRRVPTQLTQHVFAHSSYRLNLFMILIGRERDPGAAHRRHGGSRHLRAVSANVSRDESPGGSIHPAALG